MAVAVPRVSGFADLELVGRGGFSTVYSATQVDLGRAVAIKVLNFDVTEGASQRRFERECRVVGILSGVSGIVAVHQSAFTEDGRPCIVMELMRGGSLEEYVQSSGVLSPADLLRLAEVLGGALGAAHERGVVHRDIKPGNVLLSGTGEVALADFGISSVDHLAASSQTVESLSPPYAPPERFLAGEYDEQLADLYSLGATLHFAMTGQAPFGTARDGGVSALVQRVMSEPAPVVERPDVPEGFLQIVGRLLDKRPDRRPSSATLFTAEVREVADATTSVPPRAVEVVEPTTPAPDPLGESLPPILPPESLHIPAPPTASTAFDFPLVRVGDPYQPPPDGGDPVETAGSGTMWPTAVDYVQAIQDPGALVGRGLADAAIERDLLGMPVSASGQSAVVFQVGTSDGAAAIRFFTRSPDLAQRRYDALAAHVDSSPCPPLVPARWIANAIRVDGVVRPAVWMPWLPGRPLNLVVEDLFEDPLRLEALAEGFLDTLATLKSAGVAHGDLQNGNILVDDDLSIRLVDLDGVWIPSLAGSPPSESGHRCFQHPRRAQADWGPGIDSFSGLLIYTSLLALSVDPDLWSFHQGENLVLGQDDLHHPGATDAWAGMERSPSGRVRALTAVLIEQCKNTVPPTVDVYDIVALHAPVEDHTVPRRRTDRAAPSAVGVAEPDALPEGSRLAEASDWWVGDALPGESAAPALTEETAAVGAPTSVRPPSKVARLGNSPEMRGLIPGVFAGAVGGAVHLLAASSVNADQAMVPPIVLIVVTSVFFCGLHSAWQMLTATWPRRSAVKFLTGAGAGLVAAVPVSFYVALAGATDEATHHYDVDALIAPLPLAICGLLLGGSLGLAVGATRSLRRPALACVFGALAGAAGMWMLPTVGWPGIDDPALAHVAVVAFALGLIGLALGVAERVSRRSWVVVSSGRLQGRQLTIDGSLTIGSEADRGADMVLRGDGAVQPGHARIERAPNGTMTLVPEHEVLVNGRSVANPFALTAGDSVTIGSTELTIQSKPGVRS